MELRKVDESNLWKIVALSVAPEQTGFVATVMESILEAYAAQASGGVALPFGVYEEDTPVGFVMFGYGKSGDPDEPDVAQGNYTIWRFLIDQRYQGRGLGRKALALALDYLRTNPAGPAEAVWLSYEPENARAKALYHAFGFEENGEMCGGETVAVRPLA